MAAADLDEKNAGILDGFIKLTTRWYESNDILERIKSIRKEWEEIEDNQSFFLIDDTHGKKGKDYVEEICQIIEDYSKDRQSINSAKPKVYRSIRQLMGCFGGVLNQRYRLYLLASSFSNTSTVKHNLKNGGVWETIKSRNNFVAYATDAINGIAADQQRCFEQSIGTWSAYQSLKKYIRRPSNDRSNGNSGNNGNGGGIGTGGRRGDFCFAVMDVYAPGTNQFYYAFSGSEKHMNQQLKKALQAINNASIFRNRKRAVLKDEVLYCLKNGNDTLEYGLAEKVSPKPKCFPRMYSCCERKMYLPFAQSLKTFLKGKSGIRVFVYCRYKECIICKRTKTYYYQKNRQRIAKWINRADPTQRRHGAISQKTVAALDTFALQCISAGRMGNVVIGSN